MIKADFSEIKELEKDLKTFAAKAYPFATKSTLNGAAWKARGFAQSNIKRSFVLRNKFTEGSVRVDQARTLRVSRQEAVVGTIAGYLEAQEHGAVKTRQGGVGVPIPTSYAAGQSPGSRPRSRLITRRNKLSNIDLGSKRAGKQDVLLKVRQAVESNKRVIFHYDSLLRVVGGRRGTKRGWPKGARLRRIYNLSRPSIVIPKSPWMAPAAQETEKLIPGLYLEALRFQARRHRLPFAVRSK